MPPDYSISASLEKPKRDGDVKRRAFLSVYPRACDNETDKRMNGMFIKSYRKNDNEREFLIDSDSRGRS